MLLLHGKSHFVIHTHKCCFIGLLARSHVQRTKIEKRRKLRWKVFPFHYIIFIWYVSSVFLSLCGCMCRFSVNYSVFACSTMTTTTTSVGSCYCCWWWWWWWWWRPIRFRVYEKLCAFSHIKRTTHLIKFYWLFEMVAWFASFAVVGFSVLKMNVRWYCCNTHQLSSVMYGAIRFISVALTSSHSPSLDMYVLYIDSIGSGCCLFYEG